MKLLKKECFNRWYGLWPYYVAFTVSRLPFQILFNVIFLSMTYWMSGLPCDAHRFALYVLVGLVVSFVAEGLGLAIGASFSITVSWIILINHSGNATNPAACIMCGLGYAILMFNTRVLNIHCCINTIDPHVACLFKLLLYTGLMNKPSFDMTQPHHCALI